MIDLDAVRDRLERNREVFRALVAGVSDDEAARKPDLGRWSLREIVGHLADEERLDFRKRIDLLLHYPGEAWPPIDPEGWVTARKYNERPLADAFADFEAERLESLAWLAGLDGPDWEAVYHHPQGFDLRAGDLLASWLAHDALHLRQIVGLRFDAGGLLTAPYSTDYAGTW